MATTIEPEQTLDHDPIPPSLPLLPHSTHTAVFRWLTERQLNAYHRVKLLRARDLRPGMCLPTGVTMGNNLLWAAQFVEIIAIQVLISGTLQVSTAKNASFLVSPATMLPAAPYIPEINLTLSPEGPGKVLICAKEIDTAERAS